MCVVVVSLVINIKSWLQEEEKPDLEKYVGLLWVDGIPFRTMGTGLKGLYLTGMLAPSLPHGKLSRPFWEPFPNCYVDPGQDPLY